MTQKTLTDLLRQAAHNPNLSEAELSLMRRTLGISTHNYRCARGIPLPNPSIMPPQEYYENQGEEITYVLVLMMDKIRRKRISGRVTDKATRMVLNLLRNSVRRRCAERKRFVDVTEEEARRNDPMLFDDSSEEKLEEFEPFYRDGVIDLLELYLWFASCHGETVGVAAKRIKLNPATAQQIMNRAAPRMQEYIVNRDAGLPPKPRPTDGRSRVIDEAQEKVLIKALCRVVGRAILKK